MGFLQNITLNVNNEPVRSQDFLNNTQRIIEGSGLQSYEIAGDGIYSKDAEADFIKEFIAGAKKNKLYKSRLQNKNLKLDGDFSINLSLSSPTASAINFNISMQSSGDLEIVKT